MAQQAEQTRYTYVLRSPVDSTPIYVGVGIWDRAYKHRQQDSAIGAHIRGLVADGLTPSYERLSVASTEEAYELEELLVDEIGRRDIGTGPLFNRRPGGRKVHQSAATRAKLSASHMGKHLSEAHKAAVSRTLTGRRQSEAVKQAQSIRMKRWWTERKLLTESRS